MMEIADAVHAAGAYFYCDGANFNAIVGKVRPGDLGIDAMHINLHKTFSTPHGGGGPGAGPVVLSDALAPSRRCRFVVKDGDGLPADRGHGAKRRRRQAVRPHVRLPRPDGHVHARADLHAQPWRATACARSPRMRCCQRQLHPGAPEGRDERAVRRRPVHARGAVRRQLPRGHGVTTLDFAKALIDEGYHPMTMYFPLVVHGAMLIEPTETEIQGDRSTSSSMRCARWPSGPRPGDRALRRRRRISRRAAGSTRPRRRASRCCAGGRNLKQAAE